MSESVRRALGKEKKRFTDGLEFLYWYYIFVNDVVWRMIRYIFSALHLPTLTAVSIAIRSIHRDLFFLVLPIHRGLCELGSHLSTTTAVPVLVPRARCVFLSFRRSAVFFGRVELILSRQG